VHDLVAITRTLNAAQVEAAYRNGIFPMGGPGGITWHQPDVRAVLPLDRIHVPRSLQRVIRKQDYAVTCNRAFAAVMDGCADREETWITRSIKKVYQDLHRSGKAHSLEVWVQGNLAGGIYGVQLGAGFFAESMFHRVTNMSKVALVELAQRLRAGGFQLMEVQYMTRHLATFGVVEISDVAYQDRLQQALASSAVFAAD